MRKILALLWVMCCITQMLTSCQPDLPSENTDKTEIPSAPTTATTEDTNEKMTFETVKNPVFHTGADPWVIEHEGQYFYCFSNGNGVSVNKLQNLNQITTRNSRTVYTAPAGTKYSAEYWAPELHYLQGEWYIYVAADDGRNENHRMYVLKGTTQDPRDPFQMVGQITDVTNKWAIDGTVLEYNNGLYFVWSGWEGDQNVAQNIYIAHMSDPCTIDSHRVLLSAPDYSWEQTGFPHVNEGPVALKHQNDVFLIYSASGSWTDDYCLGMLTLTGDDPMNPDHWIKAEKPVFKKEENVAYGPGHCSFAPASDGSIWMIYHANITSGTGWSGRSIWIAPVEFSLEGTPIFGSPAKTVLFPAQS